MAAKQTNTPTDAVQLKKKRSRYGVVLLCLLLVNAIVITGVLWWLYGVLENFEAGTPATALTGYFQQIEKRDFVTIHKEAGFEPSRWNSWEDYDAFLTELYTAPAEEYSWRRSAQTTDDGGQVYAVFHGEERVGELALYDGQGEGGGWKVRALYSYNVPAYTVTAPGHVTVYVNGIALEAQEATADAVPYGFEALPQAELRPHAYTWELEPMLEKAVFTAEDKSGNPVELAVDDEACTVVATAPLSAEQAAVYAARIEEVAKVYASFISEDTPKSVLLGHLYPGTDFYSRMAGYVTMWYISHESYDFLDLAVFNIVSCSETCFVGEISFTFEVTRTTKTDTFPSHYQMMFTKLDGEWMLLELQVL